MSVVDKETKARIKKAKSKYDRAVKLTRKSLFNLRPDYNQGASLFEEAAMMFQNLGKNQEALKCLLGAGDANMKCNNPTMAGKNYEQAGKFLCGIKQYKEALKHFEKASIVFYEDGKPERSTEILIRAAESLQKTGSNQEKIIELYKRAIEIMADNEKFHYGMSHYNSFNSYLVKAGKYEDVLSNLIEQKKAFKHLKQQHNIWKANLSVIIVCLQIGDLERADKYLDEFQKENKKWMSQEEYMVADRFIDICDNRDEKALVVIRKDSKIKYIQSSISRLGRKMTFANIKNKRTKKTMINLDSGTDEEEEEGESDDEGEGNR